MAINYIQGNSTYSGNSASNISTLIFLADVTAGNLLVVALSCKDTGNNSSVTDSQGNTYYLAGSTIANGSLDFSNAIFYAIAQSSGSNTVSVQFTNYADYRRVLIHEYSGVDTLDGANGSIGSSGLIDSGSVTTNHAEELLFGWGLSNNGTTTAGTNFTIRQTAGSESTEDQIVSSIGTYSAIYPDDSSAWICQIATFYSSSVPSLTALPWFRFT